MEVQSLNQQAVDELCAAVIREAYNDLIKALLFETMVKNTRRSYNCYNRVREFTREKRCRKYNNHSRTIKDQLDCAKRDIEKLEAWFMTSERYKLLAKQTSGDWFVRMAHKKVGDFSADKVMELDLSIVIKDRDADWYAEKKAEWKAARDAWRKEHGLDEVKDV